MRFNIWSSILDTTSKTQHQSETDVSLQRMDLMILTRNWSKLRHHLRTTVGQWETYNFELASGRDCSALHLACEFDPPLDVVKMIVNAAPHVVSQYDSSGRMPLHAAASSHASLSVIRYLIQSYYAAVSVTDKQGKTPLILLCEHMSDFKPTMPLSECGCSETEWWTQKLSITSELCDADPFLVLVEDECGMDALEYAIATDADSSIVRALMEKSKKAKAENQNRHSLSRTRRTRRTEKLMIHPVKVA